MEWEDTKENDVTDEVVLGETTKEEWKRWELGPVGPSQVRRQEIVVSEGSTSRESQD